MELKGYMPFDCQWGFVFVPSAGTDAAMLSRTAAHEVGHGMFNLRHIFSDKNIVVLSKGNTDNLMDYPSTSSGQAPATRLCKYQWDYIHDPQKVWFKWLEKEDEGAMKKLQGTYTIWVGDSIVRDKKVLINTNKKNKIFIKYDPVAGDTSTFIYSKVVYRPQWSKEDKSWPVTTWGEINVNTKRYFPLDSLPEGKYMVLLKNNKGQIDTVKFYLRNKKYDFSCEVCGRDLTITLDKLKLIFPNNKDLNQNHVNYLNEALKKGGFTTCKRHAHFFSQVAIESDNFTKFEEDYYYRLYGINSEGKEIGIYTTFGTQNNDSYKTLYSQDFWDKNHHLDYISTNKCEYRYQKKDKYTDIKDKKARYAGQDTITKTRKGYTIKFPEKFVKDTTGVYINYTIADVKKNGENLFNLVYKDINGNTQEGDGWKYRGRGAIQITGRSIYRNTCSTCNNTFSKSFDWENNPDKLKDDDESKIYSAVCWFLNNFKPISKLDEMTSYQVTKKVNSKELKKEDRLKKYNELLNDGRLYNCEKK